MSNPTLAGFDKHARQFIDEIVRYGWRGRVTSKGGYLAKSPDGITLTVPQKMQGAGYSRNGDQARSIFRRWLHDQGHLAPEDAAVVDTYVHAVEAEMDGDTISADILIGASQRHFADREQQVATTSPAITSERPWLARKQPSKTGGTKYESAAVVERQWDNGTVDYACSVCLAGWTSPNPRSVAAHYGHAHTVRGEGIPTAEAQQHLQPGGDYTEPETTREYTPTDRLLEALTAFLREQIAEVPMGAEDLARLFLTWAHERPDLDPEAREPIALTDAQIVARIRSMVWQPIAVDLANAQDELQKAREEVAEARRQRDDVTARMASVERDLKALDDIIKGIGR